MRTVIKATILIASAIGAALPTGPAVAQAPGPASLVPANALKKISEHVHIIPDQNAQFVPNVGIVVGSGATLVIDTGMGARNAKTVLAEVAKVARGKDLYLVTTHFHPEHDLGAHAFPAQTQLLRSKDQQADIQEFGLLLANAFKNISPLNAELLEGAEFRKADLTFEKEHSLDLGGVRVRILAMGPNHTRGDTAVWVETDKVFFAGDVAMRNAPSFASPYSKVAHWLSSLDRIEALQPKIIVPSHGPTGGIELLQTYRRYFKQVQTRTAELKTQGRTLEQAIQTLTAELGSQFSDPRRVSGAVRAAYAE